jgi:hypothetical protein
MRIAGAANWRALEYSFRFPHSAGSAATQKRQCLQRLPQPHFVGENAAEAVLAQKVQPRHALVFGKAAAPFPSRRAAGIPAWPRRFAWPRARARRRAPGLSNRCAAATWLRESRPAAADAIARRVLLRRAIEQHLLQFLHRAGINHRHLAVLQARVVLPGQNQPLNVRRRKGFAIAAANTTPRSNHCTPDDVI